MNIVEQEYDPAIKVDQIDEHPDNPRRGDDSAVAESVEANGFFGGVLVHKTTGHVLAGNTRLRVARAAGAETVPGFWIDCDDATARRILLADNRVSDLAYYDDSSLLKVLQEVANDSGGTLLGTGYDQAAMELLMQAAGADSILGGVRQGATPEDRADTYDDADIRSIILPYQREEFERVVAGLGQLRTAFGVDTNAEVVLQLVANATDA